MKTQHTKGEWEQKGHIIESVETHEEIAWIKALSTGSSRSAEAEANARLIASAPALLAESQKLIENIRDYLSDVEDINSIIPINALCEVIKEATEE